LMVVGRDLEEFRSFISQRLFKLRMYNVLEDGRQLFCVALTVRCEDPVGWIAVWRRCYDSLNDAAEFLASIDTIARNRLGEWLVVEVEHLQVTS
jgi:hypothetical protein